MRFRHLIIFIVFILFVQNGFCQKKDKSKDAELEVNANVTPTNLALAKFEINEIKKKGIIVRLKTNKDRIAAYRRSGNAKVADNMEQEAIETNRFLMNAFVAQWTYCPVYFMESQHSSSLILHDSLIVKTSDLERDTVLYMNRDSFFLIDYGILMANEPQSENTTYKDINKTQESSTPASDECLVVKDSRSRQLQYPFPFFTKLALLNLDKAVSQDGYTPEKFNYSISKLIALMSLGEKTKEQKDTINQLLTDTYYSVQKNNTHNKFQKSVSRLNKRFIAYYCLRLDKDKNILCNDDPYYWWQRNPNIRYQISLTKLESQLVDNSDKGPTYINTSSPVRNHSSRPTFQPRR